jgi:hypothetical protein
MTIREQILSSRHLLTVGLLEKWGIMKNKFGLLAFCAGLVASGLFGAQAHATSGELYGVPSTCTAAGYLCVYHYTGFRYTPYSVYNSSVWPSSIAYDDASAFNNGTYSWDSRINTSNGYYCLTFGRSWHDLSLVGPPSGGNYYKKGFQNLWYPFYC